MVGKVGVLVGSGGNVGEGGTGVLVQVGGAAVVFTGVFVGAGAAVVFFGVLVGSTAKVLVGSGSSASSVVGDGVRVGKVSVCSGVMVWRASVGLEVGKTVPVCPFVSVGGYEVIMAAVPFSAVSRSSPDWQGATPDRPRL